MVKYVCDMCNRLIEDERAISHYKVKKAIPSQPSDFIWTRLDLCWSCEEEFKKLKERNIDEF